MGPTRRDIFKWTFPELSSSEFLDWKSKSKGVMCGELGIPKEISKIKICFNLPTRKGETISQKKKTLKGLQEFRKLQVVTHLTRAAMSLLEINSIAKIMITNQLCFTD